MTDQPAAIAVDGLTRDFGSVRALNGLTFSIPRGQVAGLLGHNGAGKTTTIRILNGVLSATAGSARVLGLNPALDGPAIRARTGVLTETPSLDERLTARENLTTAAQVFGVAPARVKARVNALLEQFGLADRATDRAGGFSRGMKQRLALARALVHEPELIFLDEPTAALDPVGARDVHELIRQYAGEQHRSVVITTHNLVEAQRLCDRVVILRKGRPIADGTPADLGRAISATGRVEIEVAPADGPAALAAVHAGPLDGATARLEGTVVVIEALAREALPQLVRLVAGAGVSIYRVTPSEPSLEDVYFALHDEDGA